MSSTISAYKRCSIRIYLQLFVRGLMSYASYLCLFAHNGVQHVLTILVTWRVSCWRQELLSFRRRLCSLQVFRVVRVAPLCSFQCCVLVFCLSSSCVVCAQCWQCLWIACLRPVSCVPNVASVSGLSFTDYIRFSLTFISHVLICRIEIICVCEQLKE